MTKEEEQQERRYASMGFDLYFNTLSKKTLFINTFALGSWITGVELARIGDTDCTIINPGTDEEEVYSIIKRLSVDYDQIIIAGYPPFVKNMINNGMHKIEWRKYKIHFILGGEGMPEELRDYIWQKVGKKSIVISVYGASDIGLTGMNETSESIKIRRLAKDNLELRKDLFGKTNTLPMLFQYDPSSFFIETNQYNELLFTTLNLKEIQPLIRYNLKDTGGIITYKHMTEILNQHKIEMKFTFPFPFLYVFGRSDGTLNFYGSLIYPNMVKEAIFKNKNLLKNTTNKFRNRIIYDKEHKPYIQIEIQLNRGKKPDRKLIKEFKEKIEDFLFIRSEDLKPKRDYFAKEYKSGFVKIVLYTYERYPYDEKIKIHYK
jgi:phenylacetate-CoA ligase